MRRLASLTVLVVALLFTPGCQTLRAVAKVADNVCELIAPASVCAVLTAALGTVDEARDAIEEMRKKNDEVGDANPPLTGAPPPTGHGPGGI